MVKDLYDRVKDVLSTWKTDVNASGQPMPPEADVRGDVEAALNDHFGHDAEGNAIDDHSADEEDEEVEAEEADDENE